MLFPVVALFANNLLPSISDHCMHVFTLFIRFFVIHVYIRLSLKDQLIMHALELPWECCALLKRSLASCKTLSF